MGCDIHLCTEVRTDTGWRPIYGESEYRGTVLDWAYYRRNYNLFALLAGVRNYHEITPIVEPRGLPDDVSLEVVRLKRDWGLDAHTPSHYTLQELKDWGRWDDEFIEDGLVSMSSFIVYLVQGKPRSWCRGVGGGNVEIVCENEMQEKVIELFSGSLSMLSSFPTREEYDEKFDGTRFYCWVSWPITYKDAAGEHFWEAMSEIETRAQEEFNVTNKDDIRIVFWFDN